MNRKKPPGLLGGFSLFRCLAGLALLPCLAVGLVPLPHVQGDLHHQVGICIGRAGSWCPYEGGCGT